MRICLARLSSLPPASSSTPRPACSADPSTLPRRSPSAPPPQVCVAWRDQPEPEPHAARGPQRRRRGRARHPHWRQEACRQRRRRRPLGRGGRRSARRVRGGAARAVSGRRGAGLLGLGTWEASGFARESWVPERWWYHTSSKTHKAAGRSVAPAAHMALARRSAAARPHHTNRTCDFATRHGPRIPPPKWRSTFWWRACRAVHNMCMHTKIDPIYGLHIACHMQGCPAPGRPRGLRTRHGDHGHAQTGVPGTRLLGSAPHSRLSNASCAAAAPKRRASTRCNLLLRYN